jgi:hypothetical protein
MNDKPRRLTIAELCEQQQMTRVLRHWLQKAIEQEEPIAAIHEALQPLADSDAFQDFDWGIIEAALEEILQEQQTLQGAASKAALQITGLSIPQRL